MRRLGNDEVELSPVPGKPQHFTWETENGSGKIREDRLPRQARGGPSMVVPDLSRIKGTRQHREAQEAKQCRPRSS